MSTTQEAMSTWLHQPDKSLSLSLHQWGGGRVLETIYNYKRGTEKTILKGCPPPPPKTKAFKKIVSCNGGRLIKPTSPLLSSPLLSLISPLLLLLLLLLLGPRHGMNPLIIIIIISLAQLQKDSLKHWYLPDYNWLIFFFFLRRVMGLHGWWVPPYPLLPSSPLLSSPPSKVKDSKYSQVCLSATLHGVLNF